MAAPTSHSSRQPLVERRLWPVTPSEAVQPLKWPPWRPSETARSYKRARTTTKDGEMLFMIYTASAFTINAVDEKGALIPSFCIRAPSLSVPVGSGVTVIGSDLHIFGGLLRGSSLDTYTFDLRKIPDALKQGKGLFQWLVPDPQKMIHLKLCPVVYYVRQRIYVLSISLHDHQSSIKDFEYRPYPFEPQTPWSALDNLPLSSDSETRLCCRVLAEIDSHALAGDMSIVISLMRNRGVYALCLASHTWTPVETRPHFTAQPVLLPNGIYISPSDSTLRVFGDDICSRPLRKLSIRKTSRCVSHSTIHQVAILGDVILVIRCGSPVKDDEGLREVYMTIDTYRLSPRGDRITALDNPPELLLQAKHPEGHPSWLYCFPVSSDALQALTGRKERPSKRARTSVTVQDPDSPRYGSEVLFMIYTGLGLSIYAVDQNGALLPSYCIKAPRPCCTGVTVIGSDLHIFGGFCDGGQDSLDTYTLDLHNIPRALEQGRDLFELFVRDPYKMIDKKVCPVVYYARGRIYVLSGCIHDSNWPGIDCEYRLFPFKPDAPWSRLDKPPIQKEWEGSSFIAAHALVGDSSIVISLWNNRGAYVLSLESLTWIRLETTRLCFTGQPALLPSGIYISPSKSTLEVFNDVSSPPVGRLSIRGTSRCLRHTTTHQVAAIGDVAFVIRCGSSKRDEYRRAVYITIDKYKVSPAGDHITKLLCPPKLSLEDSHPSGRLSWLSCFPVLLHG